MLRYARHETEPARPLMTFNFRYLVFLLFMTLLPAPAVLNAAEPLTLADQKDIYDLPLHMDILEDKTRQLTVYDVASEEWAGQFEANTRQHPNFRFSDSAFWVRMEIQNESRQIGWIMAFFNTTMQSIDNIELYVPGGADTYRSVVREKEGLSVGQGPNAAMFIVSIPQGHTRTVFIRIQDEALTLLPCFLYNQKSIQSLNRMSIYIYVILGIIVFFSIYNLLLFSSLKERVFLVYSGVLISEVLVLLLLWIPEFLPWMTDWWMNRLHEVICLLNAILWLLVTQTFFRKTHYRQPVNRILLLFFFGFIILGGLFFWLPFHTAALMTAYAMVVFAAMMFGLSLFGLSRKLTATRYFSMGMLLLALCWSALYLNQLGFISLSFFYFNVIRVFQLVVVLLFFSFALLDDYKLAENKMRAHMHEADQLKDDFLANTSHELRTPLHGIIGLSEDLLAKSAGRMHPDWENTIALIIKSGRRLTRLIDDILDFSKIKRKDLHISPKPSDFRSICALAVTLCRPMIGQKKINLKTRFPETLHYVLADEDRLQQIMLNLLGNAVKFTQSGEIEITALEKKGMLEVSIRDTGIGISDEKLETIFDDFTQADGSMHREYGGTGLGLAITKKLNPDCSGC